MNKKTIKTLMACLPLLLASCGAKKAIVTESVKPVAVAKVSAQSTDVQKLAFVQKVSDNKVYSNNIVGDMSFTLTTGNKDISVPGAVHMRKNEVIRIQLFIPFLGTEVGRLEFTPDYVLVVDRMHKEYTKGDYNQLSFLKENGINFYSLQSLFWNQLFLPGQNEVTESSLGKYDVALDETGENGKVTLKSGNMKLQWNTDKKTGRINSTNVTYISATKSVSTLNWDYSDFTNVGVKQFPATQSFKFATTVNRKKQEATVTIKMDEVKSDSKWEPQTTVSTKYKKVEAEELMKKIMSM